LLSSKQNLYRWSHIYIKDITKKTKQRQTICAKDMMNIRLLLLFFNLVVLVYTQNTTFPDCKSGPLSAFPICDQSLPNRVRAADVVSRMNTTEKISQMIRSSVAIPRLGIPKFTWGSEALHGVAHSAGVIFGGDFPSATSFPMPINLGASFNMHLVHRMATIISTEARAFSNGGQASLSYFTPNINIFRDPRWGRGQETPGEDPFLTSQYTYALIDGLQNGDDERYLKIAADCKHFDAYDLENWNGVDRHHFNAIVSDLDLVETYLPPFETCVRDAHVASIMCSYNMLNGVPACANPFLLQTIAR
jgi:beta-D-xylosidase 4